MIYSIITVFVIVVLYVYYHRKKNRPKVQNGYKKIPEEASLPIIGVLHKVESPMCNYLTELSKKHGPIYRIKLGMRDVVVLNSFQYIKEALVTHGETFSGRWKSMRYTVCSNDQGVIFIDGDIWSEHRSFILRTLKYFGIGRARSEEIVQGECLYLLKDIAALEGKIVNLAKFIEVYTQNVISKFVMNKRFEHGDTEVEVVDRVLKSYAKGKDLIAFYLLIFPFLDNLAWINRFIVWIAGRQSLFNDCHRMLKGIIEEHRSQLDFNSEGEDLIDRFLITQHQMKEKHGHVHTFSDMQLVRNALDLLMAGSETVSTSLVWCFMFMARYPAVQNKIHKEIMDQIGRERLPTMRDKKCLNYVQAVIDEVFRLSSIVPLSLFHRTLGDSCIGGYFIPKDTVIIPNIFACHIDPSVWERPDEFYPEHFLKKDDNLGWKYSPREELIVFGMGKRQCIGESLARKEVFLFLTSVMQKFEVSFPHDLSKLDKFDVYEGKEGMARWTDLYNFIFTQRK